MKMILQKVLQRIAPYAGLHVLDAGDPRLHFHAFFYLRHTGRRLEHLASLRLPTHGLSVLEVGAGIGDHSGYYLDRGCQVTITEPREENLAILRRRYPDADIRHLDLETPGTELGDAMFDITHCYGLLYHLQNPAKALAYLASITRSMLLLETCVSFGDEPQVNVVTEPQEDPTQAASGKGCRPTRRWIFDRLSELFPHVYVPATQPNHPEFPLDWTRPDQHQAPLCRAIFIASKALLTNDQLTDSLPSIQQRHA